MSIPRIPMRRGFTPIEGFSFVKEEPKKTPTKDIDVDSDSGYESSEPETSTSCKHPTRVTSGWAPISSTIKEDAPSIHKAPTPSTYFVPITRTLIKEEKPKREVVLPLVISVNPVIQSTRIIESVVVKQTVGFLPVIAPGYSNPIAVPVVKNIVVNNPVPVYSEKGAVYITPSSYNPLVRIAPHLVRF